MFYANSDHLSQNIKQMFQTQPDLTVVFMGYVIKTALFRTVLSWLKD